MWGLTGLFVLRLFYLVTIASFVKAFIGAKDAMSADASQRIESDAADAFAMLFYRLKRKWPMPGKVLKLLMPGMAERLKDGRSDIPNAVTPEELAQLSDFSVTEASMMLGHYASKLTDEYGISALTEKNSRLRFLPGHFAGSSEEVPSPETGLSPELREVLADAGVTSAVSKWLLDHGITEVSAFADLAESKAEIAYVVGMPAGLNPADALQTQPLKSAWRDAEAIRKAQLEARTKEWV